MFKQDLLIVFSDAFIFLGLLGAACLSASFMCFMNNYLAIFNIHLEFYKTGLFAAFWIHSYFFFFRIIIKNIRLRLLFNLKMFLDVLQLNILGRLHFIARRFIIFCSQEKFVLYIILL